MNPRSVPAVEFTPVFDWNPPRRRKLSLISFIASSAVLHALCFYLFQIIYPPTVALLPPPAQVHVITGDSEEGRVLLRWIEAEDPALSSTTQRPPDAAPLALPAPAHVPSYANYQPALRTPPPYQPDLSVPSGHPPGPVPTPRPAAPSQPPSTATVLRFDEAPFVSAPTLPPLKFSASVREPPQSARYRVAINSAGEVRYCFLDRSSGDAALDEQGRSCLVRVRFAPIENPKSKIENQLVWTTATIDWGNDIALPPSTPAGTPAP